MKLKTKLEELLSAPENSSSYGARKGRFLQYSAAKNATRTTSRPWNPALYNPNLTTTPSSEFYAGGGLGFAPKPRYGVSPTTRRPSPPPTTTSAGTTRPSKTSTSTPVPRITYTRTPSMTWSGTNDNVIRRLDKSTTTTPTTTSTRPTTRRPARLFAGKPTTTVRSTTTTTRRSTTIKTTTPTTTSRPSPTTARSTTSTSLSTSTTPEISRARKLKILIDQELEQRRLAGITTVSPFSTPRPSYTSSAAPAPPAIEWSSASPSTTLAAIVSTTTALPIISTGLLIASEMGNHTSTEDNRGSVYDESSGIHVFELHTPSAGYGAMAIAIAAFAAFAFLLCICYGITKYCQVVCPCCKQGYQRPATQQNIELREVQVAPLIRHGAPRSRPIAYDDI